MRLAALLGEPQRNIGRIISKLEDLSGYHSEDVRLLVEMDAQLGRKITQLGLDPTDTTGEELYEALKARMARDLGQLERAWHLEGENNLFQIIKVLEHFGGHEEFLAIRCSAVKRLLNAQKPLKTTKLLGYRSLASMLKHEDTRLVLAVAWANESAQWRSRFAHYVSRLKANDYEVRPVKFVAARSLAADVAVVPLMGAVCICAKAQGAASVLHGIAALDNLAVQNRLLSSHQFSADFNKLAERILSGHYEETVQVEGHDFVSRHSLLQPDEREPTAFQRLGSAHPLLAWWQQAACLAKEDNGPVSLHPGDCLENYLGNTAYQGRHAENFVSTLKERLLAQYSKYSGVKNYLRPPVDDTFINIDGLGSRQALPEYEEILS